MIKLLGHYLKKRLHVLIIVSAIIVILHMIIYGGDYLIKSVRDSGYGEYEVLVATNNPINYFLTFAILLTFLVPIFEFRFKMNKVSVDHFYDLPIKREKLYATKFILGFIEIIIPLTVFFIYTLISIAVNENIFDLKYYFIFYFVSLLLIFAIYSINSFAFTRCNRVIDGIINMGSYVLIFIAVYLFCLVSLMLPMAIIDKESIVDTLAFNEMYLLMPQVGYITIGRWLNDMMDCSGYIYNIFDVEIYFLIALVLLGIACAVLLIVLSKKEKAEKALDISDSYFAYKVIIPLYTFLLALATPELFMLVFAIIAGYIGYVIYRRSFKIKKIDIIILSSTILTSVIYGILVDLFLKPIVY